MQLPSNFDYQPFVQEALDIVTRLMTDGAGQTYLGEPVSQLEHGVQAAKLAKTSRDEEMVIAALLHDIGHLCFPDADQMADVGVMHHELLGAEFLFGLGFSSRVCDLVAGHVAAKRYRVTAESGYRSKLSAASIKTLGFQGGPMTAAEVSHFQQMPDFRALLKLRALDEAAKISGVNSGGMDQFEETLSSHLELNRLTDLQLAQFHQQGFLHLPGYLSGRQSKVYQDLATEMQLWPETPGKWMKYFELTSSGRKLCRVENFCGFEPLLTHLLTGPRLHQLISELLGEKAVLFKEKINFKLPAGSGFAAHQDAPAFTSFNQSIHITAMLSFDASTQENGCLEVSPGAWRDLDVLMNDDLTIHPDASENLVWLPVPTNAGDLVVFDSFIPHRSGPNKTDQPRRALYVTYNKASEGQVRERYFDLKRKSFPPDVEREPGKVYDDSGVFNVGNPLNGAPVGD